MTFHAALDPGAVRRLVDAFARKPAGVAPRRALQQALLEREVPSVELQPRFRLRLEGARTPETFATPLVRIYDLRTRALSAQRYDLALGSAVRRTLPG